MADVARRRDGATSLIYTRRPKALEASAGAALQEVPVLGFAEAVMLDSGASVGSSAAPAIVIDLDTLKTHGV